MSLVRDIVTRTKTLLLSALRTSPSAWWGTVREPFTGAWQRNVECESPQNILAFSAVYACVSLIADDISKLRIKLMRQVDADRWQEITDPRSPHLAVLRKPNRYQTRIQFLNQWITCKLLYGNVYVLLERDARPVVTAQYILDPRLVSVLVAQDGSVFYRLKLDYLSGVSEEITVPAGDIIHDRMTTPWHPLIGVSPIYACGASSTQGIRIQAQSAKFFENRSLPSGMLTAPDEIPDDTAARLKAEFEQRFSGSNLGRLFVAGSGLKFDPFTMPADDAQLIEQLRWTVEDVARPFKMPLHKLGMGQPTLTSIGALNQDYYSQCLQTHIEAIELLEDEALGLPALGYGIELDLDGLLRMDPISRADKNEKAIRAGYLAPNEARRSENLPDVAGGDSPMLQQQNYSLAALDKRDNRPDPFAPITPPAPPPAALPAPAEDKPTAEDKPAEDTPPPKWLADFAQKFAPPQPPAVDYVRIRDDVGEWIVAREMQHDAQRRIEQDAAAAQVSAMLARMEAIEAGVKTFPELLAEATKPEPVPEPTEDDGAALLCARILENIAAFPPLELAHE